MGNSNSEVMKSIMGMKTPITNRIDICSEDCKDDIMRMNLIKLRKTEILSKLEVIIRGNRMIVVCPPNSYSIPFDRLEAKEVLNFLMGEEKDNMSSDKELLEALKVVGGKILKDIEVSDEEFAEKVLSKKNSNPSPIAELLKDKEAVKELADIFANSVVNKFAERFCGFPPSMGSVECNNGEFKRTIEMT